MPQTIYCDESGFTGPYLSDKEQPHFVYTSVAISAESATELVRDARENFPIRSPEIKGSTLIKSAKGLDLRKFTSKISTVDLRPWLSTCAALRENRRTDLDAITLCLLE
jgi:Protein of unknown function (DUF3800)